MTGLSVQQPKSLQQPINQTRPSILHTSQSVLTPYLLTAGYHFLLPARTYPNAALAAHAPSADQPGYPSPTRPASPPPHLAHPRSPSQKRRFQGTVRPGPGAPQGTQRKRGQGRDRARVAMEGRKRRLLGRCLGRVRPQCHEFVPRPHLHYHKNLQDLLTCECRLVGA